MLSPWSARKWRQNLAFFLQHELNVEEQGVLHTNQIVLHSYQYYRFSLYQLLMKRREKSADRIDKWRDLTIVFSRQKKSRWAVEDYEAPVAHLTAIRISNNNK